MKGGRWEHPMRTRRMEQMTRPPSRAASRWKIWKMMSVRAVGRTPMVAGPIEEVVDEVDDPAEDARAGNGLELFIGQHAEFRVRLVHALHCRLPLVRSGGPFRRRWRDIAAGPRAPL